MEDFKNFAVSVVDTIVDYITYRSYSDNLDLSVGGIEYDVRGEDSNSDSRMLNYTCRIYNNALQDKNSILVSVSLWGNTYTVDIFSAYFHNFGINALVGSFVLNHTSVTNADVNVRYLVQLDTSSSVSLDTDDVSGTLSTMDSDFVSSVTVDGVLSLKKDLTFDLVLDLFQRLLLKSNLALRDSVCHHLGIKG